MTIIPEAIVVDGGVGGETRFINAIIGIIRNDVVGNVWGGGLAEDSTTIISSISCYHTVCDVWGGSIAVDSATIISSISRYFTVCDVWGGGVLAIDATCIIPCYGVVGDGG